MEEERIKTALELAMERISSLPELTSEEIAEQKEKECVPIGTAIAVKYLNDTISDGELQAELSRYDKDRRKIVCRSLISSLSREIRIENSKEARMKALRGLEQIAPHKKELFEESRKTISRTINEFESARERRAVEFKNAAIQSMQGLGISGSAIRPNLNENELWKKELSNLQQVYEPRLEQLREILMRELC